MADKIATRQAYGEALIELVEKNDKVVVLDADLANATQTCKVAKAHPEKFYNCGIAEANMVDIAAGMSTMGLIPYCSSFAMFAAGRAYEQIRNSIAYPHFNVKICATHAGVSVGEDGGSHQCIEDIALMRVIPGMTVICPADANEAKAATTAIADFDGPVYMRLARLATPVFEGDMVKPFVLGKANVLREGKDVAIFATGLMVSESLAAAEKLAKEGIDVRLNTEVTDVNTLRGFDEIIVASGSIPRTMPSIPGFEKTLTFTELLKDKKEVGDKVLFIGGGQSSCEAAYDLLLNYGKHPIIVEYANDLVAAQATCLANTSYLRDAMEYRSLSDLKGQEFYGEYYAKTNPLGANVPNPVSHVAYGYATQMCILDKETGKIKKMVAAHDVGKAINPLSCEGQIEGGVVMSMGYALTEQYPLDHGKPTAKYGTLGLFRSHQIPEIKAIVIDKPGLNLANGAIGIGEITSIPTAPAIAQAYYRYDGERRRSLPLDHTPYKK